MRIISSAGKGDFILQETDQKICEMHYKNWFSGSAHTRLKGNQIELSPKNVWANKVRIHKNGRIIGDIAFNLRAQMIIRLETEEEKDIRYILKNKGSMKARFQVYNESEALQFTLLSEWVWKKFRYNYEIEFADFDERIDRDELLAYCGYAANLYFALISTV
ncbi:hypothetical protein LAG90_05715 [Marinilongibacter aquaticus]|uniref:hypothetical protein n=1 Tax=Marinilongibacter aquaticus TaxID=2975157 RepID=UPI0021BD2A94|nr:hypothetical protein [Marinilongibacter aquaticus]UBM60137.1 hypothetical protein LAG90_05715 [Marinilongibacter aquaticus]